MADYHRSYNLGYSVFMIAFLTAVTLEIRCVNGWRQNCSKIFQSFHSRFEYDANITGRWTSTRCEVQPGPVYLLRYYNFEDDGHFLLHHHFYLDPDCSKPNVTLTTSGRFIDGSLESSRIIGATERRYVLRKIHLRCDIKRFRGLFPRPSRACLSCLRRKYHSKHIKLLVYSSRSNCDCLDELGFYLGELEVMKVVRVQDYHKHNAQATQLFAGDVTTKFQSRKYFRSNTFQAPLEKLTTRSSNERMQIASPYSPRLKETVVSPSSQHFSLVGNWISIRCEVRPQSTFVMRHLHFSTNDSMWSATYKYYVDPRCSLPYYTLRAYGRYKKLDKNTTYYTDCVFTAERMYFVSHNSNFTSLLNNIKPRTEKLETEHEYDVSKVEGVPLTDFGLPRKEYERIMLRKLEGMWLLFTGRRPIDGGIPDFEEKRATSFQDELLRCHSSCLLKMGNAGSLCFTETSMIPTNISTGKTNFVKQPNLLTTAGYQKKAPKSSANCTHFTSLLLICLLFVLSCSYLTIS